MPAPDPPLRRAVALALATAACAVPLGGYAQCALSCPPAVRVSIAGPASDCRTVVDAALLGASAGACADTLDVIVTTPSGAALPGDTIGGVRVGVVDAAHIGRRLRATIRARASGNACATLLDVVDGARPRITVRDTALSTLHDIRPASQGGQAPDAEVEDCTPVSLRYVDSTANGGCVAAAFAKTYRRWVATDAAGNSATATQLIEQVAPALEELRAPGDTILPCDYGAVGGVDLGVLALHFGGSPNNPRVSLRSLDGNVGELYWNHTDETFVGAGGATVVLRSWRVYDGCRAVVGGVNPLTLVQRISLLDAGAPRVELAVDSLVVLTDGQDCRGGVVLPPASVSDDCDPAPTTRVEIDGTSLVANGGYVGRLAPGRYRAVYTAVDAAGNDARDSLWVRVRDAAPPALLTKPSLSVSLSSDGTARVAATAFDAGTTDDCGQFELGLRRFGDTDFARSIVVSCSDVDSSGVSVELRAVDEIGNANVAEGKLYVRDVLAPLLVAPGSVRVECGTDLTDLSVLGVPYVTDNCEFELRDSVELALDNCGVGTIIRRWEAIDPSGNASVAVQSIAVDYVAGFGESYIEWPADTSLTSCGSTDPGTMSMGHAGPRFAETGCERVSFGYKDQSFTPGRHGACRSLRRVWTVRDDCAARAGESVYEWTHAQWVDVFDDGDPLWGVPADTIYVVAQYESCDSVGVSLPEPPPQVCGNSRLESVELRDSVGQLIRSFESYPDWFNLSVGRYSLEALARNYCGREDRYVTTVVVRPGERCQRETVLVHGRILDASGSPVDAIVTAVDRVGDTLAQSYVDNGGRYALEVARADSALLLTRSEVNPVAGVTGYDLYLVARHVLGTTPLVTARGFLAADANGSRSLSAFDITTLRRLILGLTPTLPGARSYAVVPVDSLARAVGEEWRSLTAPVSLSTTRDTLALDLRAVKVGDVSAAVNGLDDPSLSARSREDLSYAWRRGGAEWHLTYVGEATLRLGYLGVDVPAEGVRLSPKLTPGAQVNRERQRLRADVLWPGEPAQFAPGEVLLSCPRRPGGEVRVELVRWGGAAAPAGGGASAVESIVQRIAPPAAGDRSGDDEAAGRGVAVYPNPVRRGTVLRATAEGEVESIRLFDARGMEVGAERSPGVRVPPGLPAGIYSVEVVRAGGRRSLQRVIVE